MIIFNEGNVDCPYSNDYFAKFAKDFENEDASPTFSMLSEAACSHGITIVGGSVPESSDGQLYNTSCVFGPDGKLKAKHRKVSTDSYLFCLSF